FCACIFSPSIFFPTVRAYYSQDKRPDASLKKSIPLYSGVQPFRGRLPRSCPHAKPCPFCNAYSTGRGTGLPCLCLATAPLATAPLAFRCLGLRWGFLGDTRRRGGEVV